MALITTAGDSTSNSLVTLAEADAILALSPWADTWDEFEDEEKENLLILAALAMRNLNWDGWLVYEKQALPWPRWPFDDEDFDEESAETPDNVKSGQCYLAIDWVYRGLQGRTSPSAGPATDAIKSLSLFGDISLSFNGQPDMTLKNGLSLPAMLKSGHTEIYLLLAPYCSEVGFISGLSIDAEPELLDEVT